MHGIVLDADPAALRVWAEADPAAAAALILDFAGPEWASARLAAGLLLQADLRPDDLILVLVQGPEPDWLPQALKMTRGRAETPAEAAVLIANHPPAALPRKLRRLILLGGVAITVPPEITVSRPEDWTYPSESSAD